MLQALISASNYVKYDSSCSARFPDPSTAYDSDKYLGPITNQG